MNIPMQTLFAAALTAGTAFAQSSDLLVAFSSPERTVSGSGGTVLGELLPNEIQHLRFGGPCSLLSAEKWLPRTCSTVMSGDEDGDGAYFRPGIFGRIDAVLSTTGPVTAGLSTSQRTVFWSPSQPMGNAVSAAPFRPGDVARLVRNGLGDGQVQYFMRQEHFNTALGLPPGYPIDVDAIAFQPNYGVFFSIEGDVLASTVCGPTLVRDGDVLCVPGSALGYTPDLRIAGVMPNSAVVVYDEAQMDAFTANAQVADRFGACVVAVEDVEALEMDLTAPSTWVTTCAGIALPVPNLIYASRNGTGASLLQTLGGGSIWTTPCGLAGTPCGSGPTFGPQLGIRPFSTAAGAASHCSGLALARACVHTLEPAQHVLPSTAAGYPFGATTIDYHNPFVLSLVLIELAPPAVAASVPAAPFSLQCFPDLYTPSLIGWMPVGPGFGSIPTPAIPPAWSGKLLFQGVGFATGTFELSTPAALEIL